MDLENNYVETVRLVLSIREALKRKLQIRSVNFDSIKRISFPAALLLASEIDSWNQKCNYRLKANDKHWTPGVKRLLTQMGFYSLMNLPEPPLLQIPTEHSFMPLFSNMIGADIDPGTTAKKLRICIEERTESELDRESLFGGISEAITNVSHHAYSRPGDERQKLYWASASYDRRTGQLWVAFLDHGDGIPYTLPKSEKFERIWDLIGKWDDADRIHAAMAYGRSRTNQQGRGKGLTNLCEFATVAKQGELKITSNRGRYMNGFAGGRKVKTRKSMLPRSIGGTLIEWIIHVDQPN